MKKIVFLMLMSSAALAQQVDYNKIILPDYTKSPDFSERLVQLAWRNHPNNEVFRKEVDIGNYATRQSAAAWLDIFRATGNLNEFTLSPQSDVFGRSAFWPRYNLSASISLGQFISIPLQTKMNRAKAVQAQANLNAQKLAVRNAVLKAYNEYIMREEVYKVQSQLLLDNETAHKLVEQRFKNGETNFETYSASLASYSSMNIARMDAEKNYKNAKLDLEQLIGMRLEDVR